MMIGIIRSIKGTVDFKIMVADSEGFIKEASGCGKLYNLTCKELWLYGCCDVATYKKLTPIVKKYHGRRRIIKKRGVRFKFHQSKKRKGILFGTVASVVLLIVLSQFVWSISISGGTEEIRMALRKNLSSYGIKNGTFKRNLDTTVLENKILVDFPEISFLSVNISGATISIEIDETENSPIVPKDGRYGNIIASKDGRIVSAEVYNGISQIQEGDAVFKGELLVSGTKEDYFGRIIFLQSDAKIFARTENTVVIKLPAKVLLEKETGRKITKRYLSIFNLNIPLHMHFFTRGFYNDTVTGTRLNLGGVDLPVFYTKVELQEIEFEEIIKTEDELKKEAELMLKEELQKMDDKEDIKVSDVVFEFTGDELILTATYSAVEDIAEYIPFEYEN